MRGGNGKLEQYVGQKYCNELTKSGYQPVTYQADEDIENSLKLLAHYNQSFLMFSQKSQAAGAA
jgi:oligoribonuclease (3'-5' exoribonuclease)